MVGNHVLFHATVPITLSARGNAVGNNMPCDHELANEQACFLLEKGSNIRTNCRCPCYTYHVQTLQQELDQMKGAAVI